MRLPAESSGSLGPSLRAARLLALAVPAALLAGAYVAQFGFALYPCEMCWWQRYPHFAAVALAGLAYVAAPARLWTALAALAILVSAALGAFHAGVEYGWWQGVTSCARIVPSDPGSSPLEAIMNTPMISCDEPQWTMLGISLAGFNFLFGAAGALAILALIARKDRA